jgi:hypothetical protein
VISLGLAYWVLGSANNDLYCLAYLRATHEPAYHVGYCPLLTHRDPVTDSPWNHGCHDDGSPVQLATLLVYHANLVIRLARNYRLEKQTFRKGYKSILYTAYARSVAEYNMPNEPLGY